MYIVWLLWILFRILKHYNIHGMTIHCRFLYYYKLLIDLDLLVCGFQLNFRTPQLPPTQWRRNIVQNFGQKMHSVSITSSRGKYSKVNIIETATYAFTLRRFIILIVGVQRFASIDQTWSNTSSSSFGEILDITTS